MVRDATMSLDMRVLRGPNPGQFTLGGLALSLSPYLRAMLLLLMMTMSKILASRTYATYLPAYYVLSQLASQPQRRCYFHIIKALVRCVTHFHSHVFISCYVISRAKKFDPSRDLAG